MMIENTSRALITKKPAWLKKGYTADNYFLLKSNVKFNEIPIGASQPVFSPSIRKLHVCLGGLCIQ